MTFDLDI